MQPLERLKEILLDNQIRNIAILPHNMPDGDTLGSAIGVLCLLRYFNKEGYIVLNDGIPSNLSFLFKNEVKRYRLDEVEHIHFDACIAVDSGETKLFEDRLTLFKSAKHQISIDHHKTNSYYADINIVDELASSTGEMVFQLFKSMNCPLDDVSGEALYAAIVTDTGSFRYSNTRPLTFSICKELQETNFDFNRLNVEIFQNKSYEKLLLLNKVFETLELHAKGKCAVIKLTKDMMDVLKLSEYDTDGIVEFVRDIQGVEVVVFIRYLNSGGHKVSMRSKYDFDVSRVALAFKGGGHTKAAGFKTDEPLEFALKKLVQVISESFEPA